MEDSQIKKKFSVKSFIAILFIIIVICWIVYGLINGTESSGIETKAKEFSMLLLSILLEALPFVLLGTIISSLIQVFVTEDTIMRVLPKNNILRLIFSACLGIIFPVCECAIIPITRGLVKKGMPIGPAIAFMLAVPIMNPVVLLSTYNAFSTMPMMTLYRGVFGFMGAIIIGYLMDNHSKDILLKTDNQLSCGCGHDHHHHHEESCGCGHDHHHDHSHKRTLKSIIKEIVNHTNIELQSVGAYLIFGAIIATSMQLFVPKYILFSVGNSRGGSILSMMSLAFVLSLCSEADAFIANTFLLHFSAASVLAFLITGPMIDIKNTMMLFGSFKRKFVIKLIAIILIVCFVLSFIASFIIGGVYA